MLSICVSSFMIFCMVRDAYYSMHLWPCFNCLHCIVNFLSVCCMKCYVLSVIMLVISIKLGSAYSGVIYCLWLSNCSFWSIGHDCASNVRVLLVIVYFLCELGFLVRCCRRLRYNWFRSVISSCLLSTWIGLLCETLAPFAS